MITGLEYPKWIRHPGKDDVLVDNAEAASAQLAAWAGEPKPSRAPRNALLAQLDHDDDGNAGGSKAGTGEDIASLRAAYKEKLGKRAFPGWSADEIRARLAQAA